MKRITACLALVLALALLLQGAAFAEGEKPVSGGFSYTVLEDGSAAIDGYGGFDSILTIPASVEGHPVSAVSAGAFRGSVWLRNVTIEEGVREIGDGAFRDCSGLESIVIPSSAERIGDSAFRLCENLSGLEIPDGVRIIGRYAFTGCGKLGTLRLPDSVETISENAFTYCSLASADLGNGVREIGSQAFMRNDFTEITLPDSVETIGANPFDGCRKLTEITVSPEHAYLEAADGVLYSRKDRRLVCCPQGRIYDTLAVKEGTQIIGDYAFDGTVHCHQVTLPESLTAIGDEAFNICDAGIGIPAGVTTLGRNPFWGMEASQLAVSPENPALAMAEDGDSAVLYDRREGRIIAAFGPRAVFPEGVRAIGDGAFWMNDELEEVTIPEGVTAVGNEAFVFCPALRRVTVPGSVSSIGEAAFEDCGELVCAVKAGSYAEAYCRENGVPYETAGGSGE